MSCLSFPRFPSSYVSYPSTLVSYPPFWFHSFLFTFHTHLIWWKFLVVKIYPPTVHLGFIKPLLLEIDQKSFFFPPQFLLLSWEAPLKQPLSLVMSPPFSSGALSKPSPRRSRAPSLPSPPQSTAVLSFWVLSASWGWSSSFLSPASTYLCDILSIVAMRLEQKGGVQAWTHHITLTRC